MRKEEREKLFAEAHQKRRLCADWLKTLMIPGVPKPATKAELYAWARDNLGVSRSAFDAGWIWAEARPASRSQRRREEGAEPEP